MPRRMIYVRDADQELWAQAERLAGDNESLAGVVAAALREYIAAHKAWGPPSKRFRAVPETTSVTLARDVRGRSQAAFDQMKELADLKRRVQRLEKKGGGSR